MDTALVEVRRRVLGNSQLYCRAEAPGIFSFEHLFRGSSGSDFGISAARILYFAAEHFGHFTDWCWCTVNGHHVRYEVECYPVLGAAVHVNMV